MTFLTLPKIYVSCKNKKKYLNSVFSVFERCKLCSIFHRCVNPIKGFISSSVEPDGDGRLEYMSPPKRFHTGPSTPDRMIPHPLAHR